MKKKNIQKIATAGAFVVVYVVTFVCSACAFFALLAIVLTAFLIGGWPFGVDGELEFVEALIKAGRICAAISFIVSFFSAYATCKADVAERNALS